MFQCMDGEEDDTRFLFRRLSMFIPAGKDGRGVALVKYPTFGIGAISSETVCELARDRIIFIADANEAAVTQFLDLWEPNRVKAVNGSILDNVVAMHRGR